MRQVLVLNGPNLPWQAARRQGIPVVHTLHDYWLLCPSTTLTRRDATPCRPSPFLCGARTRRMAG